MGKVYIRDCAISYPSVINALKNEHFSDEDAVFAVDHCDVDWNAEAAGAAKLSLDVIQMSCGELIDQSKFDEFTEKQAIYGVEQNGYESLLGSIKKLSGRNPTTSPVWKKESALLWTGFFTSRDQTYGLL